MGKDQVHESGSSNVFYLASSGILILWFCQDLILSESVPFFRDLNTYFYPLRFSLYESYRAGTLPLWDRHMAMGFPLLADFQSGAFYPPHLLFLILPFFAAIRLLFVLHFLIAALGACQLLRYWKYPGYLAVLGSLLFALGGTVVSLTNLLNHFQTAVWLPWVILAWEKAARDGSWKNFLTLVLLMGAQFLAGSPELFAFSMALVLLDGIRIKLAAPEISIRQMATIFFSANFLVAAVTMAQLLPTAELLFESRRQQPLPPQEAFMWSLNPRTLLNLFYLDKEVYLNNPSGMRFFFAREAPFFISYYLGAISFFGICLWLGLGRWRNKAAALGLVGGSVIFAMGYHTPVYPFLYQHLPLLGAFRFPEKFFFITYALLVYLALRGLAKLDECNRAGFKKIIILLGAGCAAWIGLYLYLRWDLSAVSSLIVPNVGAVYSPTVHAETLAGALANLERQIILSVVLLILVILYKSKAIRRSLFAFLLVAAVFVDLAWAHRGLLLPLDSELVYGTARILKEPDQQPKRLFYFPSDRSLHPSSLMAQGRPTFKQAAALPVQNLLPNDGIFYGFDYFQEIDAIGRRPYSQFLAAANPLDGEKKIKLLGTFNVGYLLSFRPLEMTGITLVNQFPEFLSWLYKIDETVPRVYLVNHSVVEPNASAVLQRLAAPEFDPMRTVVLDEEPGVASRQPLVAHAKIVRYENQKATIHASLNDSGILVFADSYYPGWKAYVDGSEKKILRANLFFRAVPLTAGGHIVEFRYEPRAYAMGLAISLVTLACLILFSLFVCLAKRRRRRSAMVA